MSLQAQHKISGILAAAKICEIQQEEDLDDFVVEIDILSECKHKNIVELLEAYVYQDKLWVSHSTFTSTQESVFLRTINHILQLCFDCDAHNTDVN